MLCITYVHAIRFLPFSSAGMPEEFSIVIGLQLQLPFYSKLSRCYLVVLSMLRPALRYF